MLYSVVNADVTVVHERLYERYCHHAWITESMFVAVWSSCGQLTVAADQVAVTRRAVARMRRWPERLGACR